MKYSLAAMVLVGLASAEQLQSTNLAHAEPEGEALAKPADAAAEKSTDKKTETKDEPKKAAEATEAAPAADKAASGHGASRPAGRRPSV